MKILSLFLILIVGVCVARYTPDWDSIDSRPLPSWYDESKFGIFIHWGLYAVPSFGCTEEGGSSGEWYWWLKDGEHNACYNAFHNKTYGPNFKYEDFATMWHAELFNATEWAQLFAASGARYVVLTSKHHEGWTNWKSAQSWNWNSVDNGPHIDIIDAVAKAVRAEKLRFGLYHSLFEWFNPLYLADKQENTTVYVDTVLMPQLHDIVNTYQPEIIWADGDWEMPDTYWRSTEFLAWLYNDSPVNATVLTNDRWGIGTNCKNGGYWTCEDRYNPGQLVNHKWENCFTVDSSSWGFRRNMHLTDVMTANDLITEMISTVAFGGNFLLNVGPTPEGTIVPIFAERLTQIGDWLKINGDAVYKTTPWRAQNESDYCYYTSKGETVYATVVTWPKNGDVVLSAPVVANAKATISMLGYGTVPFTTSNNKIHVKLSEVPLSKLPSPHAWVLVLKGFK